KLKLDQVNPDLPNGAGPINFIKDFGDTAALMLTVASPKVNDIELELRAKSLQKAIESVRKGAPTAPDVPAMPAKPSERVTFVITFPPSINTSALRRTMLVGTQNFIETAAAADARMIEGPGYMGIDLLTSMEDRQLLEFTYQFARDRMRLSELH